MNTPLISALLPSAAPQTSSITGSGSGAEGSSFASILSGQQSQFESAQGSVSGSGGQNVSQQNNAPAQPSQSASMPSGNAGAASGSAAQSSSTQAPANQGAHSAQSNGSDESSQASAPNQDTEASTTAATNSVANQSTTQAESAAANQQSQDTLNLAAQQAASAFLPALMASAAGVAEAGTADILTIDQLAATTDALSGNALSGQGAQAQPGGRNGTKTEFSAFAGLGRPEATSGVASALNTDAATAVSSLQGGLGAQITANPLSKAQAATRPSAAASVSQTALSGSLAASPEGSANAALTPLASALGSLAVAGTPGSDQAFGPASGAANLAGARSKASFASAAASGAAAGSANASSLKWDNSSLSKAQLTGEGTENFLSLLSSSRQLFGVADASALQQSDTFGAQEIAHSAVTGLAQASAGAASAQGTPVSAGLAVSATVATPLSSPQWGTDFTRTVFNLSQNSNQGPMVAEMRLDPPDLGPIRITLTLHDNVMQAAFVSPHSVVRQTVENALPQLQQLLAQAGIALGDASVNDQGTPGQSEQAGQGSGNSQASGSSGPDTAVLGSIGGAGTVAAAEAARGAADPNALVDTFA